MDRPPSTADAKLPPPKGYITDLAQLMTCMHGAGMEQRLALLRGLADRSRLTILEHLRHGPCRVSDVVEATGLTQANASAHLGCLWDCGLVSREKRGREVHYELLPGVEDLLEAADRVLHVAGESVGACPTFEGRSGRRSG